MSDTNFIPLPEGGFIVLQGKTIQITQLERIQLHHMLKPSTPAGRLNKQDFALFDEFLFKHGWGGYSDFVETLRDIAVSMGAGYCTREGYLDLSRFKTIPSILAVMEAWAWCLAKYNMDHTLNRDVDKFEDIQAYFIDRRSRLDRF